MAKQQLARGLRFRPDPLGRDIFELERMLGFKMEYTPTDRVTTQGVLDERPDPYGVLVQEARGTREMVTSDQLPKDMHTEELEKLGIQILGPSKGDKLFNDVKLPDGWTKVQCSEDSRTTYLVDPDGHKRAYVWYKAASYDRSAYGVVRRRFEIITRNFNDYTIGVGWVLDAKNPSAKTPAFQTADRTYASPREGLREESREVLRAECVAWLNEHYPDWKECTAYWNAEVPQAGVFPPWEQRTR
jgi:hypothetical protein